MTRLQRIARLIPAVLALSAWLVVAGPDAVVAHAPATTSTLASPMAAPTATASAGEALPAAYVGTWSGTMDQVITPVGSYPMTMVLHASSIGAEPGDVSYPTLPCTTKLILRSVDPQAVTADEQVITGSCLEGTFTLRLSGKTLTATWRTTTGEIGATASLTAGLNAAGCYDGIFTGPSINSTIAAEYCATAARVNGYAATPPCHGANSPCHNASGGYAESHAPLDRIYFSSGHSHDPCRADFDNQGNPTVNATGMYILFVDSSGNLSDLRGADSSCLQIPSYDVT